MLTYRCSIFILLITSFCISQGVIKTDIQLHHPLFPAINLLGDRHKISLLSPTEKISDQNYLKHIYHAANQGDIVLIESMVHGYPDGGIASRMNRLHNLAKATQEVYKSTFPNDVDNLFYFDANKIPHTYGYDTRLLIAAAIGIYNEHLQMPNDLKKLSLQDIIDEQLAIAAYILRCLQEHANVVRHYPTVVQSILQVVRNIGHGCNAVRSFSAQHNLSISKPLVQYLDADNEDIEGPFPELHQLLVDLLTKYCLNGLECCFFFDILRRSARHKGSIIVLTGNNHINLLQKLLRGIGYQSL